MVVAAAVVGYAVVSGPLASSVVSGPMLFLAVGLALGPAGLDLVSLARDPEPIRALLELTLVLVLFTDAAAVPAQALRRAHALPIRLLAIGLPLTIGLGWLLAWPLLPGLSGWELALVGVILAPTDAALGQSAIANPGVPAVVRYGLNVESGLNDGMALPFFALFLAAAAAHGGAQGGAQGPLEVFWRALMVSTVLGGATGWLAGSAERWAQAKGWVSRPWRQILVVATALGGYFLALAVGGSGFIAAWVAGLAFGSAQRHPAIPDDQLHKDGGLRRTAEFAEDLAGLLTLVSFLVFGAVLLGPALQHLDWRPVAYALVSLTVVRMLPVAVALRGSRLRWPTVAYIGWFGPRGLASLVLGLLVLEEAVPGVALVAQTVAITVGLSVLAHGATAVPLAARYARWFTRISAAEPALPENASPLSTPRIGRHGEGNRSGARR